LTEKIRLVGHMAAVTDISFHPDNQSMVSASIDHTMVLWCLNTGLHKMKIHRDNPINDICFSPNGLTILEAVGDGTVRITPNLAWEHRVPSAVESEIFRNDIKSMRIEFGKNWSRTPTAFILKSHPEVLLNSNEEDKSNRNLVHVAAKFGCVGFLETFIQEVALNSSEKSEKRLVLSACLMRDSKDRTPLYYAVESQDTACITAILDCLMLAFNDDFALLSSDCATYTHLADLFPLEDLICVIEKFPTIGLKYLGQMKLVNAYESLVLKDCERIPLEDDDQIVKGSDVRSPKGFWKREYPSAAYVERRDILDSQHQSSGNQRPLRSFSMGSLLFASSTTSGLLNLEEAYGVPVIAKLLPLKNVAKSGLLKVAVRASEEIKSFTVFESEVLMALTNFKWETRVKRQFMKHLYMEIFMVGLFTADALLHSKSFKFDGEFKIKFDGSYSSYKDIFFMLPGILILLPWIFFVRHEYLQFRAGKVGMKSHLLGSIINFMDFTSLFLILVTFCFRVFEWSTYFTEIWFSFFGENIRENARVMSTVTMALGLPILYLNLLKYMQAFRTAGELVSMIFGVLKGIMPFTMILVIVMVGFSLAFFVLFSGKDESFGNIWMSVFTAYIWMFGEFDTDNFGATANYYAMVGLFIVFMYILNVVLFNLLIAIMGDIYDSIQENARAQFLFSKASLILEFEEVMGKDKDESHTHAPKWLQILEPIKAKSESDSESWAGKVKSIKKAITSAAQKSKDIIEDVYVKTGDILNVVREHSSDVAEVKEELGELRMVLLQMMKENSSVKEMLQIMREENKSLKEMMMRGEGEGRHRHSRHHASPALPPPVVNAGGGGALRQGLGKPHQQRSPTTIKRRGVQQGAQRSTTSPSKDCMLHLNMLLATQHLQLLCNIEQTNPSHHPKHPPQLVYTETTVPTTLNDLSTLEVILVDLTRLKRYLPLNPLRVNVLLDRLLDDETMHRCGLRLANSMDPRYSLRIQPGVHKGINDQDMCSLNKGKPLSPLSHIKDKGRRGVLPPLVYTVAEPR